MSQLAECAKFIGRRDEITEVAILLEKAARAEGQFMLISGETGIGKTRFVNEIRSLPIGERFQWLTTSCIYQEGADPYLPFTDALRSWLGPDTVTKPTGEVKETEKPLADEFELADLARIPVIGPKLTEDPSMSFGSFIIKEPKSEFCFKVFRTLINHGRKGLCITRIPLERLKEFMDNKNLKTFWLSSRPGESCLPPSLTKISHEITQYIGFYPNSVVILDGLEYLISHLEFNKVLRFVNELIDSMAVHKSILLIPINPLTIDPKQLALLERNMNTIDMTTDEVLSTDSTGDTGVVIEEHKFNEEKLEQGRNIMFETTTQKIMKIASTKPVVLFIDDLQWADACALHLLHYLARATRNYQIAIIGAYRPDDLVAAETAHPLQALMDRLIPEKLLKIIKLDRFNELETGGMIESLLQNTTFPDELVNFIYHETEGNPFFIEEIVRSLEEEKVIKYNENLASWSLTRKLPEVGVPQTVKEVLLARINRLPKDMRLLLEIASVLGVEFEYNILTGVSKLDEEQVVSYLDDLIRYNLLIEQPTKFGEPITYRFVHNKICEVLYNGLSQTHKRLLHSKAATAIEDRYKSDLDSTIYELAQHCYHSGDHHRGLKYCMRAGEKALLSYAPGKARTFFKWALDSIELGEARGTETESNDDQYSKILISLIETCTLIGEWDEALKYIDDLLKLGKEKDNKNLMIKAYNYAGKIHIHRTSWTDAIKNFNDALSLAKASDFHEGMLEAYEGLGDVHERRGEYPEAMNYTKNFMELAESMESHNEIARGYKALAMISIKFGDYRRALDYYKKCIDVFNETKNYTELAKVYTNIGIPYFELGEFEKVIEWNEKSIELASRTGDIRTKGLGYSNAAEVYARKRKFEKALDYANRAIEIFTKIDDKPMIGLVWMNYGIIYKNKEDWDSSRYYFEKSLALLKGLNVPYFLADCTRQFGLMLSDQGTKESLAESRSNLESALAIFEELGSKKFINVIQKELDELPP
ncbi:tetratricopeptide repeat protein [[Eubacterium] cellulosolvens]